MRRDAGVQASLMARAEYLESHARGSVMAGSQEYLELYGKCR